jgi:hypothetical protein
MKYIILLFCGFFCLFLLTACPVRIDVIIANQNPNTIELLQPDGRRKALLKSGDIKKTLFPASTMAKSNASLIYVKIENIVFTYEFPSPSWASGRLSWGAGYMKSGKFKVIFHEDKKFYIIPYNEKWGDVLQNREQPEGWPVSPNQGSAQKD